MKKTDSKFFPIFKGWAIANFPFIDEDFDQMTLYEMICKITEYLNKMRDQVNKNTETAEEYAEYLVEIRAKVAELESELVLSEESTGIGWFSRDELDKIEVFPDVKITMDYIIRTYFGGY